MSYPAWAILSAVVVCSLAHGGRNGDTGNGVWSDPAGDAAIRRTDTGNDASLPAGYQPLDLLGTTLQGWAPTSPVSDPYTGAVVEHDADILRLRIVFDGVVAPPGSLGIDGSTYQPYKYGSSPFYGYIELDVDNDNDSGGEFMPLAQNRYLANVGRFNASPAGALSERMVRTRLNGLDELDDDFDSPPFFERSGGEFALSMCGCFTPTIVSQDGNMDSVFDAGETWIVRGRFFERFAAFQDASGLQGGTQIGLFNPMVDVRFAHDIALDQTAVTLVFPITNEGAALLLGEPVQPINLDIGDHTSIFEALDDLIFSIKFATGDVLTLSELWEGRDLDDFRRPQDWFVTALVGTAPTVEDPAALFVWTDTGFNEIPGDLNSDGVQDQQDEQLLTDSIAQLDGGPSDSDGVVDGQVTLPQFSRRFDLRDRDYDGVISADDLPAEPCLADFTGNGILDFFDVSAFLTAFNNNDPIADLNGDSIFNFFDVSTFLTAFSQGCDI